MRESIEMSKKEKNAKVSVLRVSIKEDQKRVSDELGVYQNAARDVNKTAKALAAAESAYERKDTEKNAVRYDDANDSYLAAVDVYKDSGARIGRLVEVVRKRYLELADLLDEAKADKVLEEFERYNDSVMARILKIQETTETVDAYEPDEEEEDNIPMAIPEIPVSNGVPAPQAAPAPAPAAPAAQAPAYAAPAYPYPQYVPMPMPMPYPYSAPSAQPAPAQEAAQTPKIAPVSIDVSPMLEKALEATMNKFVAAFDKKIEEFIAEHPVNIPVSATPATPVAVPAGDGSYGVSEIAALEGLILDDEQALINKLTAMIENLKVLASGMAELSALCAEISEKQNTANDLQKQTNDMQRQTLRDQKGIQVGQRVVAQDQAAIAHDQTLLQEQQKTLQENQQALVEAQQAMEETQRLVSQNQTTLEEAMKDAMQVQKDMIATQQAIIVGNAKNVEAQNDVAEKQSATLALQKEALTAQRQIYRDQKATLDKQKALGGDAPKKKVKADEAPAETPAE